MRVSVDFVTVDFWDFYLISHKFPIFHIRFHVRNMATFGCYVYARGSFCKLNMANNEVEVFWNCQELSIVLDEDNRIRRETCNEKKKEMICHHQITRSNKQETSFHKVFIIRKVEHFPLAIIFQWYTQYTYSLIFLEKNYNTMQKPLFRKIFLHFNKI